MTDQHDLWLAHVFAQVLGEFDSIGHHALDRQRCFALRVAAVGLCDAALSHCTTLKLCSQARNTGVNGTNEFPGPPARISNTGLLRSSPRICTHWSMPPDMQYLIAV